MHIHNDYERTKYLGLLEFESWASRGLPGIALIPCVVYGPGAITYGNLVSKAVADIVRGRFPGVLGDGQDGLDILIRGRRGAPGISRRWTRAARASTISSAANRSRWSGS